MLFVSKYKVKHGKGGPLDLAHGKGHPLDLVYIDKVTYDKVFDHMWLKISTTKQMLQRFLIAFAQVKAGNTSENFLNEIRQILYSLY